MRDGVEGDLVRINLRLAAELRGVPGAVFGRPFAGLLRELLDGLRAGAGDGLVAGGKDALHAKGLMQRIQRHQRDGGGAVRVCDDALMALHVRGVDFRHHERDFRVLTEERGIVHDHRAGFHSMRGKVTRDAATRAEERDVDALERIRCELLDGDVLALELELLAGAARGGEESQVCDGKRAFFEAADHFHADRAGGSDDGDVLGGAHEVGLRVGVKRAARLRASARDARSSVLIQGSAVSQAARKHAPATPGAAGAFPFDPEWAGR